MSYVDFAAGKNEIIGESAEKIKKLAVISAERPGLNMDIQGTAVPEADSEALRI